MRVGPPATRTDEYLAAILEELRAVRALLEDGRPSPVFTTAVPRVDPAEQAEEPNPSPTKRTRTRARAT